MMRVFNSPWKNQSHKLTNQQTLQGVPDLLQQTSNGFLTPSNFCSWNIRDVHNDSKLGQTKILIQTQNIKILAMSKAKLSPILTARAANYVMESLS